MSASSQFLVLLFPNTHEQHADDFSRGVGERLVGCDVPGIHDEGSTFIYFAPQHGGNDRVGRAVGVEKGDVCADRALTVLALHVRGDAEHVAPLVHALEDRASAADKTCRVIHDGGGLVKRRISFQRSASDLKLRQRDRRLRFADLGYGVPCDGVGHFRHVPSGLKQLRGYGQVMTQGPFQKRLLCFARAFNTLQHADGFLLNGLVPHLVLPGQSRDIVQHDTGLGETNAIVVQGIDEDEYTIPIGACVGLER